MNYSLVFDNGARRCALPAQDLAEAARVAVRAGVLVDTAAALVCDPGAAPVDLLDALQIRPAVLVAYGQQDHPWQTPTADEIREALRIAGLTGAGAGVLVGVHGRTVRKWIGGEREIPYAAWRLICLYARLVAQPARVPLPSVE